MSKAVRLFSLPLIAALMMSGVPGITNAAETVQFKKNKSSLMTDMFEDNMFYETTQPLRMSRLYQLITRTKARAKNVNVFDEVPDSTFFTNRIGKARLSADELARGPVTGTGPDVSGTITITRGKGDGLHPGFFIKDAKGEHYLFKFDPADNLELVTSAEVIASRFYHALGYNVPEYTIAVFNPDKLAPAPGARIRDTTGFEKALTKEKLEEFLLFIPWTEQGQFRASASRILPGENKGTFAFHGRRKNDPNDPVNHEDRRELRALKVFSTWLNNYDVRQSNTLDMLVTENGKTYLKHYIIDFNSALGAAAEGAKPPMFGHEHFIDYGESTKAFLGLGLWEKPWQRSWRKAGEEVKDPAIGYFDSDNVKRYKVQFPNYAFKDVTRADGFWAAKKIMAFTNEDIATIVKEGKYSKPEVEKAVTDILIQRRNLVAGYWFAKSNPLDDIEVQNGKLSFKDLAVVHGFEKEAGSVYRAEISSVKGSKQVLESKEPVFDLSPSLNASESVSVKIRTKRPGDKNFGPYVIVDVNRQGIQRIVHQD